MWGMPAFTATRSAAPLLTRPAGTVVVAEAVPDSTSAEPAAPATSDAGTALAAVPMRAAGPGMPGLAGLASADARGLAYERYCDRVRVAVASRGVRVPLGALRVGGPRGGAWVG